MLTVDLTHRAIKRRIREILQGGDFTAAMAALEDFPARRAVNPLISFFCSGDARLRWRAVSGMGRVVSRLAEADMESSRVIMRRLMWTLNDESGGIGWGAPEAMGEITAAHAGLAREFACILVSYIRPDCNFLEHPVLQRGVLWGLGRLAHARPDRAADAAPFVAPFLESPDAFHRGHAVWLLRALNHPLADDVIEVLSGDEERFDFYLDGDLSTVTVAEALQGKRPPF
ncbi:MAG: hypothetical protein QNI85_08780 [Desulfobacterales bacterium]|nr:hypothetical protein [Desulfobacterales bacterium]MDJ0990093.1 hypothetical protein [Desulfobacterales bacterium]